MPWIITKDHFADAEKTPGTNANAVGKTGPRYYRGGTELNHKFRMLTDDREVVYEGMSGDSSDFGPLNDFGTPNFGCTIIQYWSDGDWRDL